jgi:hypothetical protein
MVKLSDYSKHKFNQSMALWQVDRDFADPMFNYLVHGFSPGSFFTAVLANDFLSAVARSHPGNTMTALKKLTGWMRDCMPRECWGNYHNVDEWIKLSWDERRAVLEAHNLIYTPKQETWLAVKGEPTFDPMDVL